MSHTYNGIEGQGALSQDFLVACHSRSLLASLPVQVSEHHIDLKHKEKTNVFMMESELRLRHEICQMTLCSIIQLLWYFLHLSRSANPYMIAQCGSKCYSAIF